MRINQRNAVTVLAVTGIALFALSGCSAGAATTTSNNTPAPKTSQTAPSADPTADLVGPGCAAYASQVPSGPGSVVGMSTDPVAVAASNDPLLKTLVAAVSGQLNSDVNLVDTLNGDQFTVFAPVDDAFAELDPATVDMLKTPAGAETLKKILTYHVVPGQLSPDTIDGMHKTVEGGTVGVLMPSAN